MSVHLDGVVSEKEASCVLGGKRGGEEIWGCQHSVFMPCSPSGANVSWRRPFLASASFISRYGGGDAWRLGWRATRVCWSPAVSRCVATVATTALERAAPHKEAAEPRERYCAAHGVLLPSHAQQPKQQARTFPPFATCSVASIRINGTVGSRSFQSVRQVVCVLKVGPDLWDFSSCGRT